MKPWLKNSNDSSTYVNIFLELSLTEKEEFCHLHLTVGHTLIFIH